MSRPDNVPMELWAVIVNLRCQLAEAESAAYRAEQGDLTALAKLYPHLLGHKSGSHFVFFDVPEVLAAAIRSATPPGAFPSSLATSNQGE